MKKSVALLLVIILLDGLAGGALAYDDEITFQGVPWGSTDKETVRILTEKGFIAENDDASMYSLMQGLGTCLLLWKDGGYATKREFGSWEPYEDYSQWLWDRKYDSCPKHIAGYDIKELILSYCVDEETSRFICAGFMVDAANPDEAYQDLLGKLNKVYGKGKEFTDPTYEIATWNGADGTAVFLQHYNPDNVWVFYGTTKSEDYFIEASRLVLNTEVPHNDVEDTTDGL